jgi:hypothetical protein
MAGHHLIDGYLAMLARQLPPDAVDELADGLTETYLRQRSAGLEPDAAARAAITEFGAPGTVLAAFAGQATGRGYRRTRLAAGAGLGLIGLDGTLLATVMLIAPPFAWPMALAVPASLARMVLTARVMPRLLAR